MLSLQAPIKVRPEREFNGEKDRKIIDYYAWAVLHL